MHGNFWEWVEDCYADSYAKAPTDGTNAPETSGCNRVSRGGSWLNNPQDLRSPDRNRFRPVSRDGDLGFRVMRSAFSARTPPK